MTFTVVEQVNPLLTLSAPLIRLSAEGDPDGLAAAVVRHVDESGTVFLELPDGRVALILDLSGRSQAAPVQIDEGHCVPARSNADEDGRRRELAPEFGCGRRVDAVEGA